MLKIRILKWCKALSSVSVILGGPSGRAEDKQMVGTAVNLGPLTPERPRSDHTYGHFAFVLPHMCEYR